MIEYFVHIDLSDSPGDLVVASAHIPEELSRSVILPEDLPQEWRNLPAPPELASIGDRFIRQAGSVILLVPSALSPSEFNWLINPAHPEFARIDIQPWQNFEYDFRFFRRAD